MRDRIQWLVLAAALLCMAGGQAWAGGDVDPLAGYVETVGEGVRVVHQSGMEETARGVIDLYTGAARKAEAALGWGAPEGVSIVLVTNRETFGALAGTSLISAYAVGESRAMVIDYTEIMARPAMLESTLTHELVHIILSARIGGQIPRWLNEGVAQWVADGPAEVIVEGGRHLIERAAVTDRLIPLPRLTGAFPPDRDGLHLAYAESKSFIEYVAERHGPGAVTGMLGLMAEGETAARAYRLRTGEPIGDAQAAWARELRRDASWPMALGPYIMDILFAFAALVLMAGFIRMYIRLKTYRDDEGEDGNDETTLSENPRRRRSGRIEEPHDDEYWH